MSAGKYKFKSGFTFAEMLIAIVLTALLLTAVGVAFDAAMDNFGENEDMFKSVNLARQSLLRLTSQLRTAQAVLTTDPNTRCTMITANGEDITYQYDSQAKTLKLITNDDLSDSDYMLCENVEAMLFTKNIADDGGVDYVKSVVITITVSEGDFEKTVSTAVALRKNL